MTNTASPAPAASARTSRNIYSDGADLVTAFDAARDERVAREEAVFTCGQASFEWSDPSVGRRYIEVLRSLRAWSPEPGRLVATVANTPDGALWGYVASEALDAVFSVVFPDAAPRVFLDEPRIVELSSTRHALEW